MSDFTANWGWPQWTILILCLLTALGKGVNHGEDRKINGFAGLLDFATTMFILIAGGFFA